VAHYGEAFSVTEGRCFRFVHSGAGHGQHCQEPVVARGTFIDGTGRQWVVDACHDHRDQLDSIEGGQIG
jgi:hypothetical protein